MTWILGALHACQALAIAVYACDGEPVLAQDVLLPLVVPSKHNAVRAFDRLRQRSPVNDWVLLDPLRACNGRCEGHKVLWPCLAAQGCLTQYSNDPVHVADDFTLRGLREPLVVFTKVAVIIIIIIIISSSFTKDVSQN